MALATSIDFPVLSEAKVRQVKPTGFTADWATLCTRADVVESDSGVVVSSKVVKPSAITRAAQKRVRVGEMGTKMAISLRYNADTVGSMLTSPVVRAFGRDMATGIWYPLQDSTGSTELTLTTSDTLDVLDESASPGPYRITKPQFVGLMGASEVMVAIQTAFSSTGGTKTDASIIAKVLGDT